MADTAQKKYETKKNYDDMLTSFIKNTFVNQNERKQLIVVRLINLSNFVLKVDFYD